MKKFWILTALLFSGNALSQPYETPVREYEDRLVKVVRQKPTTALEVETRALKEFEEDQTANRLRRSPAALESDSEYDYGEE